MADFIVDHNSPKRRRQTMFFLLVLLGLTRALGMAPLLQNEDPVPGQYIVQLEPFGNIYDVTDEMESNIPENLIDTVHHVKLLSMDQTSNMAVMELDYISLAKLRKYPYVKYIEQDAYVQVHDEEPVLAENITERAKETRTYEKARWGLDRINQEYLPMDGDWELSGNGFGAHVYIIDTGVKDTHRDFECRVDRVEDVTGSDGSDCKGRGTKVAGIVGGKTYGVANKVTMHSIRVMNCAGTGTVSDIISGIDWVIKNHVQPCVAVLPFFTPPSRKLDESVEELADAGCLPVTAAGNDPQKTELDACDFSPARSPFAITVSATDEDDYRAESSRYGTCVDIFAPGVFVKTTDPQGGNKFCYASGSSFACGFVAGVAAIHLANGVTASEVRQRILNDATVCPINDSGRGTPNRFLYISPPQ
ncbi:extracellular serine proteinase-like [Patiria miniata]|uniref:Peptidase S8/S53 domain-containing protein n=1 Tax=Patiria miniata TaxID=46514 RepID=A0A914BMF2_PATMI|nr:extracellular serine proteinase-like [Patiria miniata]